jgi:hypothetical protein
MPLNAVCTFLTQLEQSLTYFCTATKTVLLSMTTYCVVIVYTWSYMTKKHPSGI